MDKTPHYQQIFRGQQAGLSSERRGNLIGVDIIEISCIEYGQK